MDEDIVAMIRLKKHQSLQIHETGYKDVPYHKVGNGNTNEKGTSMNLIQLMADMTKPEQVMMKLLEERLEPWNPSSLNCVRLKSSDLTSTEQQYVKRAYKLLEDKKIIKRIKKEYYMFNPYLIIPPKNQLDANLLWDELTLEVNIDA